MSAAKKNVVPVKTVDLIEKRNQTLKFKNKFSETVNSSVLKHIQRMNASRDRKSSQSPLHKKAETSGSLKRKSSSNGKGMNTFDGSIYQLKSSHQRIKTFFISNKKGSDKKSPVRTFKKAQLYSTKTEVKRQHQSITALPRLDQLLNSA